jgi:lipoate synthase
MKASVIKHNIENLRTMYKEKTCKCKYSQLLNVVKTVYRVIALNAEKDTKITTMKVLALDINKNRMVY